MINVADFTKQLHKALKEAPTLADVKEVERGEYANKDAGRTPWIGVYRTEITYTPRALGQHSKSWLGELTAKLVVQAHGSDGAKAEDELEDVVQRVMAVIFTDLTLKAYVSMLNRVRIQYSYEETASKTMDYQWAFITLTYETRTGA